MSDPVRDGAPENGRLKCQPPLTPAMQRVARLLAEGYSSVEIAKQLKLAPTTVVYHIRQAGFRIPGNKPARLKLIAWYERSPTSWYREKQNPLRGLLGLN